MSCTRATCRLACMLAVTFSMAAAESLFAFDGLATGASPTIPTATRLNPCYSTLQFRPTSTQELSDFIKAARIKFSGRLRIRATRDSSHTFSTMNCPTSARGLHIVTVYVNTAHLNKTLGINPDTRIVTVQAGMQLVKFLREAHTHGLGLPSQSYPSFSAISLGGIFSVASHGSNVNGDDTLERSVLACTVVDGLGNIQKDIDPSVLHGSVGLLGIITEMTFKLGPATKTRLIVKRYNDDADITRIVDAEVQESAVTPGRSINLLWRASGGFGADFTIYQMQTVDAATPGESWNTEWAPLDPAVAAGIPATLAADATALNGPDRLGCDVSSTVWQPKTREGVTVPNWTPTVGWSHDIETSGCQYGDDGRSATVMPGKFSPTGCGDSIWTVAQYYDFEYVVPYSRWPQVVAAVKAIYAKALPLFRKGSCTRPFLIRFGRTSDRSLIAMNSDTKDDRILYISLSALRAKFQQAPPKYSQVFDEWEQYMLCDLGGRPHWGKTNDRSFVHPRCHVRGLYPRFNEFLALQQRYDPDHIYEPELFTKIKTQQGDDLTANCMSGFKCFCEADAHCPVGHRCQPGAFYQQYRVCKPLQPVQ